MVRDLLRFSLPPRKETRSITLTCTISVLLYSSPFVLPTLTWDSTAGRTVCTQPGPRCGSKRFCFMRLVVAGLLSLLSISPVAFLFTPTGRSILATAWAWLKGVFSKLSPRGILFLLRKKSHNGDELDVLFSTYDSETIARLLQVPSAALLKALPAALGAPDSPAAPYLPSLPKPFQSPLPPQLTTPQLPEANNANDANDSPSRPATLAASEGKRSRRPRASRRTPSTQRVGSQSRSHQPARKRR